LGILHREGGSLKDTMGGNPGGKEGIFWGLLSSHLKVKGLFSMFLIPFKPNFLRAPFP